MHSKYESFKEVKRKEMQVNGEIIKDSANKTKTMEKKDVILASATTFVNALRQYLYMELALITWRRYFKKFYQIKKDEVDIDSDDFELSEFEDQKKAELDEKEKRNARRQNANESAANVIMKTKVGPGGSIVDPNPRRGSLRK